MRSIIVLTCVMVIICPCTSVCMIVVLVLTDINNYRTVNDRGRTSVFLTSLIYSKVNVCVRAC